MGKAATQSVLAKNGRPPLVGAGPCARPGQPHGVAPTAWTPQNIYPQSWHAPIVVGERQKDCSSSLLFFGAPYIVRQYLCNSADRVLRCRSGRGVSPPGGTCAATPAAVPWGRGGRAREGPSSVEAPDSGRLRAQARNGTGPRAREGPSAPLTLRSGRLRAQARNGTGPRAREGPSAPLTLRSGRLRSHAEKASTACSAFFCEK